MAKPKRKFIEGHNYLEIHKFTRKLSFWEMEQSYKAMKKYRGETHDTKIPVCIRLKEGDIRVKKYDEQLGLDPKTYYGNANDIAFITFSAYDSRVEMRKRFLEGPIETHPQIKVEELSPVELLNLKEFLIDSGDEWVYIDKSQAENGKKFYIYETVDPVIIRTIYKKGLSETKKRNNFLLKYGDKNTASLELENLANFVNHFRPAKNILRETIEAIDNI